MDETLRAGASDDNKTGNRKEPKSAVTLFFVFFCSWDLRSRPEAVPHTLPLGPIKPDPLSTKPELDLNPPTALETYVSAEPDTSADELPDARLLFRRDFTRA